MFVDENGTNCMGDSLKHHENRFLCLTGVIMHLGNIEELKNSLNDIKLKYFNRKDIILHRYDIRHAKNGFEVLKDNLVRDDFNSDILKVYEDTKYRVISVLVDKLELTKRYPNPYDPYSIALEYLMQRYQYFLQDFSNEHEHVFGDMMAEKRGGLEDMTTKETYIQIYEGKGFKGLKNAHLFYSSREIKLKDKKANIPGLQLADLIAHAAERYIKKEFNLIKDYNPFAFEEKVVKLLVDDKFRRSKSGEVVGHGVVLCPTKK